MLSGGAHTHRRISWAAIFGGVILVVTIQLLLGLLGAGIGLGTVNTNNGTTLDASSIGMGAGLWWIVSSIIALGFGGYVSAWLAGIEIKWDGVLHGLITWGIATLLTVYLLTSAVGSVIGGGFSAVGGAASADGSGLKDAAQPLAQATGVSPDMLQQQVAAHDKDMTGDVARLRGQAGIANSRLAYEVYERMLQSPRWKSLAAQGARPQRLLWASTGVKDKSFPDTRYVVELVAPDTVNTMPEATLQAVADHGEIRGDTIGGSYAAAHAIMDDLHRVGVDVAEVAELLETQGTASFEKSWEELIGVRD